MEYVEPKLDGWWTRIEIAGGAYRIFTRSGAVAEQGDCPAPDAILYAEWMHGTEWSQRDPGRLVAFDLDAPGTYTQRRALLARYVRRANWDKLRLAHSTPASRKNQVWRRYVERDGWEGVVLKSDATAPGKYDGKRKRSDTWDFIVAAVHHGYSGTVASLGLQEWRDGQLVDCGRVAHLPDSVKELASRSPDRVVGQVVEVKGQERTASGAVRHPRFVRFRWDKPASQCVARITPEPQLADFFTRMFRWTGLCSHQHPS